MNQAQKIAIKYRAIRAVFRGSTIGWWMGHGDNRHFHYSNPSRIARLIYRLKHGEWHPKDMKLKQS